MLMDEKIEYLPFNAINEFMLPEYQKSILKLVFSNFESLPNYRQKSINANIKKFVQIQGFRDSSHAPQNLKTRMALPAFEKNAKFTAEILAGWFELNTELGQQVSKILIDRGWIVLPMEADRSKLPGFMVKWPADDTFDVLSEEFAKIYPDNPFTKDDISLMIVWISNRLPFDMVTENIFQKEM